MSSEYVPTMSEYHKHYVTMVLKYPWFVVANDLAGGHAIGLVNKPLSQYNFNGEPDAQPPYLVVADFMPLETASFVVALANADRWPNGIQ
jgi:hypothetical protein